MGATRIFRRLRELLDVSWGDVADGQYLMRDGDTIVGGTPSGGSGAGSVQFVEFTVSDPAYSPPAGWTYARLAILSGGGGGCSGARRASGTATSGGSGGSGSVFAFLELDASTFGATTWNVTVGAGGAGGAAITTDNTNGAVGSGGGASSVTIGTFTTAAVYQGRGDGQGGGTSASGDRSTNGTSFYSGGAGKGTSIGSAGGNTHKGMFAVPFLGAFGGSGGGGLAATPVNTAGGRQAATSFWYGDMVELATVSGGNGTHATVHGLPLPGSGGVGGGGNATGAGGTGGNGYRGGGGGGGGSSLNGFASGAGGNGGDGYIGVWFFF